MFNVDVLKHSLWYFRQFLIFISLLFIFLAPIPASALSLKEAVRMAVNNNPSGKAKKANQRAIANELEQSRSRYLPQIRLTGDIGLEKVQNPNSLSATDNGTWKTSREIGIAASLTLFDGYERANRVYRDAARLDGAVYGVLATSETLALDAVEAYIDIIRHRQLLRIAKRNIRRHREISEKIRARVAGGKSPASDRTQINERVFAAKAVEIEIRNAYQDTIAKFRKIVGTNPGRRMKIPRVKNLPRSKSLLLANSVSNNYGLKVAGKIISANEYARDATRSGKMPKLSLESRATFGADRGGSRGEQSDLYVGLKLSWNIFDGGITSSAEQASNERVSEAQYQRDLKVREIREIAERVWNKYTLGRERNSVLNAQVQTNRRIVRDYISEYGLSKRSLLDVLDAEKALFNSHFQQISVEAGYRFSAFRMLAVQSKLASYFGISAFSLAAEPNVEDRIRSRPMNIFNVNIEPLK